MKSERIVIDHWISISRMKKQANTFGSITRILFNVISDGQQEIANFIVYS
jgi:hypothetical protein